MNNITFTYNATTHQIGFYTMTIAQLLSFVLPVGNTVTGDYYLSIFPTNDPKSLILISTLYSSSFLTGCILVSLFKYGVIHKIAKLLIIPFYELFNLFSGFNISLLFIYFIRCKLYNTEIQLLELAAFILLITLPLGLLLIINTCLNFKYVSFSAILKSLNDAPNGVGTQSLKEYSNSVISIFRL